MVELLENLVRRTRETSNFVKSALSEISNKCLQEIKLNPKKATIFAVSSLIGGIIVTGVLSNSEEKSPPVSSPSTLQTKINYKNDSNVENDLIIPPSTHSLTENQRSEPYWQNQPKPVINSYTNPISQFSNDRILVYCINQAEKDYAIETIKNNNNQHRKINISKNKKKATMRDLNNRKINLDFVVYGEKIPVVTGGYDIVTFRGHVGDMPILYNRFMDQGEKLTAPNSILLLGGCRSDQYISSMATQNLAVIASTTIAYGPQNSYLLVQIIETIPRARGWNGLRQNLEKKSIRVREEFILPESQNYFERISIRTRNQR